MITQINQTSSAKTFTRISDLVTQEIAKNTIYQESLITTEMINLIYRLFTENLVNIEEISDDNLSKRIDNILATHSLVGLLDDLSPEELQIFEESVRGK